jgi:hypothetical protein
LIVDANVCPTDVIAHDEHDVGLLWLLLLLLHLLRLRLWQRHSLLLLRGHWHAHHHHRGSNGCEPDGFVTLMRRFLLSGCPRRAGSLRPSQTRAELSAR